MDEESGPGKPSDDARGLKDEVCFREATRVGQPGKEGQNEWRRGS